MHSFTDATGRRWDLAITLGSARRLLKTPVGNPPAPVDLLDAGTGQIPRLGVDLWLFVDVLFVLLSPADVTDEQFAERLTAPGVFDAARDAFWKELADFFRQAGRPLHAAAVVKQTEIESAVTRQAVAEIEAINPETMLDSGSKSTGSPENSACTPGSSTT